MSTKKRSNGRQLWNRGGATLKNYPWRLKATFGPFLRILDELEQEGTLMVSSDGRPMFKDEIDGLWCSSVESLNGLIDCFQIHSDRHNRGMDLEPLRRLSSKLYYGMPLFESDTKPARECVNRMRMEAMQMTVTYAQELIGDATIKQELEKLGEEIDSTV